MFSGRIFFFLAAHYFQRVLCFGDDFFLAAHYVRWCVMFWGRIEQEADAKTVIIYGLAVTAGQFLVISKSLENNCYRWHK